LKYNSEISKKVTFITKGRGQEVLQDSFYHIFARSQFRECLVLATIMFILHYHSKHYF